MQQTTIRRGRPKVKSDAARSADIARQARDLFLARGYAEVTMDDIAAACHISKRTLYALFRGKADIFGRVVDDHRRSMLDLPGDYDALPIDEALRRIFRIDLGSEEDHDRLAVIRLVRVEAERFPELETMLRERGGEHSRRLLADFLERRKQDGRIEVDNTWFAAKMLMDMIFGAIIAKGARGEVRWPSDAERRTYLGQCIAIFAAGVLPADSPERPRP